MATALFTQTDFVEVDVASVGVELQSREPLALLHSEWEQVLPIWIGELEASAIAQALQGVDFPRPLTHDLLVSVMGTLDGTLEEVRVTELRGGTYIGVLVVRTPDGVHEIDTRPSDGLALAVRTNARILVARNLLEEAPDLDFIAAAGGEPVIRYRGVTLGPGAEVLHVTAEVERRDLRRGDRITAVRDRAIDNPIAFLEIALDQSSSFPVDRVRDGEVETILLPAPRQPGRIGP
jgi:uncharacterized protein